VRIVAIIAFAMHEALTTTLRQAMITAQSEARALNQEFVGTEHLLLGILGCETCDASLVLERNGPKVGIVKDTLRHALPHGKEPPVVTGDLPLSPRAQRIIQESIAKAQALRETNVSTRFVFLSLLDEPDTIIRRVLAECGADVAQLQRQLAERPAQTEA
jgi:ATP-dependent Clp protease ATP-binding subunit ClpA